MKVPLPTIESKSQALASEAFRSSARLLILGGSISLFLFIAYPHSWRVAVLIIANLAMWAVVLQDKASWFEVERLFLVILTAYSVLPYVAATLFPDSAPSSPLDGKSLACILLAYAGFVLGRNSALSRKFADLSFI